MTWEPPLPHTVSYKSQVENLNSLARLGTSKRRNPFNAKKHLWILKCRVYTLQNPTNTYTPMKDRLKFSRYLFWNKSRVGYGKSHLTLDGLVSASLFISNMSIGLLGPLLPVSDMPKRDRTPIFNQETKWKNFLGHWQQKTHHKHRASRTHSFAAGSKLPYSGAIN